jgi:hypothetical protein
MLKILSFALQLATRTAWLADRRAALQAGPGLHAPARGLLRAPAGSPKIFGEEWTSCPRTQFARKLTRALVNKMGRQMVKA